MNMVKLSQFPQPTEGIRLLLQDTGVYLNNNNIGKGTLYITESELSWIGPSGNGFSVGYPHISLHAVSRDLNAFPEECLFLMLDIAIGEEERVEQEEDLEMDGHESNITTEVRFVPEDRGLLDAMFHALSACQALHPDPEESYSDEDFYEDADEGISVDETNSRLANLCIGRNNAFGMVASREAGTAADTAVDTAADTAEAGDRAYNEGEGSRAPEAGDTAGAHTQSSSGYRTTSSSHRDRAGNCSDTGCFDDVEN